MAERKNEKPREGEVFNQGCQGKKVVRVQGFGLVTKLTTRAKKLARGKHKKNRKNTWVGKVKAKGRNCPAGRRGDRGVSVRPE